MNLRSAERVELDRLAQLWFDAWQDAHAGVVPEALKQARTLESFRQRLESDLANVRVVGPKGAPLGFYLLKGDELYQLFVARDARGTGIAAALIDDAEARLAANGAVVAWLACAIGNDRAARFYEKRGWHRAGTFISELATSGGIIPLEVWRYEKVVGKGG